MRPIHLFKTRAFWITWLVVSILGAIVGIIYSHLQTRKLNQGKICTLKLYGNKEKIYILNNYGQKDQYLEFLNQKVTPESWDFDLGFGSQDAQVLVIDTLLDGKIIEFTALRNRFPDSETSKVKKRVNNWVYKEFADCTSKNPNQSLIYSSSSEHK